MKRRIVVVGAAVVCALLVAVAAWAATGHRAAPNKPLSIETVKAANEARLLAIDGVVGVGIGARDGTPVIDVFLAKDTPASKDAIPNTIGGYSVAVSVTGPISVQPGGGSSSPGAAPGSPGQPPGDDPVPPVDTPPMHVAGAPDIIGTVTTLSVADGSWNAGVLGQVLIVGKIQNGTSVDKAFVTVTDKTRIYVQTAQGRRQVDFSYLGVGQAVAVTFTGPVAESYPVQATADTIVIIK
jgi:hypothetical protein